MGSPCWPIVSDDGETLILVGVTPPFPHTPVLALYRDDHMRAKFIRLFQLESFWTPKEIDPGGRGIVVA